MAIQVPIVTKPPDISEPFWILYVRPDSDTVIKSFKMAANLIPYGQYYILYDKEDKIIFYKNKDGVEYQGPLETTYITEFILTYI